MQQSQSTMAVDDIRSKDDESKPANAETLSQLRKLWIDRTTNKDNNQGDDEEEDYVSDAFWQAVGSLVEVASCNYYGSINHRKKQKKQNMKQGSSSFCLHMAVRLTNQLATETSNQADMDLAAALVSFAMWKYPQDVNVRDPQGRLPLHVAVQSKPAGVTNLIPALLDLHPQAAESTDPNEQSKFSDDDQYPLHTALSNGHTWHAGGIQQLVENFSEVLVYAQEESGLYPYQLAACNHCDASADLSTIYRLLRTEPGVLQSNDEQEQDLGLMVMSMQYDKCLTDEEREQVLLYLTSDDDESFSGERQPPLLENNPHTAESDNEKEKVRMMRNNDFQNNESLDSSSNHSIGSSSQDGSTTKRTRRRKRRRAGRRNSFVSFDDQAKILEQAAQVYEKRKESGFRDLGLLQHIDKCKETRANLRQVGDPEALRKKKIADFIEEFRRTKPRGKHTHGLSEYEVKERLESLRKVSTNSKKENKTEGENAPVSPIAKIRAKLRSAEGPPPIVSPTKSASVKKWVPKKKSDDGFVPVAPGNFLYGGVKPQKKGLTDRLGARAQYTNTVIAPPPINTSTASQKEPAPPSVTLVYVEGMQPRPEEVEEIEQGPLSPMQIQRKKLRSVKKAQPKQQPIWPGDGTEQAPPSPPHQHMREKLRPTQTKEQTKPTDTENVSPSPPHQHIREKLRPTQTKEPAKPTETEKVSPSSPHQHIREKLRPTQTKEPAKPMETEKVSPSSPHQQLRQRLRPTQTKPRAYQSSIKNIASYERKKSPNMDDSTLLQPSKSVVEDTMAKSRAEETQEPSCRDEEKATQSDISSYTNFEYEAVPLETAGDKSSHAPLGSMDSPPYPSQNSEQTAAFFSRNNPTNECKDSIFIAGVASPTNTNGDSRLSPKAFVDNTNFDKQADATQEDGNGVESTSRDSLSHKMQPSEIMSAEEVPSPTVSAKTSTFFSGWVNQKGEPAIENDDSHSITNHVSGFEQSTENMIDMMQSPDPSSNDGRPQPPKEDKESQPTTRMAPKRQAPTRRLITADAVLRKRAEMEIRANVKKMQRRLDQYRERRLGTSQRQALSRKRKMNRLDKACKVLYCAQESIATKTFDEDVYQQAIVQVTANDEKQQGFDEDYKTTRAIEGNLVKEMHCMLALEKQEALFRQDLDKTVKYLKSCQKWLQDYHAIASGLCDLEVQNCSMLALYESTVQIQEAVIEKYATLL